MRDITSCAQALQKSEQRNLKMKENLLPNYFKKIGLIFGSLSIIFLISNLSNIDFIKSNEPFVKWIFKNLFLISLLLIAFSKEKNESDKIIKIRFEKFKQSILFSAVVLIFDSVSELVYDKNDKDLMTGFEIMIIILFFYLITYHFRKYNYR